MTGRCRLLYLMQHAITMNAANKWSNINEESDIKKHYLILLLSANRNLISPSIHKALNYLAFQILILSVPDEGYSRNVTCAHNLISTFLLTIKKGLLSNQHSTFHRNVRYIRMLTF